MKKREKKKRRPLRDFDESWAWLGDGGPGSEGRSRGGESKWREGLLKGRWLCACTGNSEENGEFQTPEENPHHGKRPKPTATPRKSLAPNSSKSPNFVSTGGGEVCFRQQRAKWLMGAPDSIPVTRWTWTSSPK